MKGFRRGFTIVELLVVIAVIGVLAGVTIIGFNQYQASARDSQRASKASVITEALEKYYDANGEYPSCPNVTGAASTVTGSGGALENVDLATLITPSATSGQTNSISCSDLTSIAGPDSFAYVGDGSADCLSGQSCLQYTLKYKDEATGTIKTIASRRSTDISTSGIIKDLTATGVSFSQINASWTGISGAASYTIQSAKNNTFTDTLAEMSSTTNSASITGLAINTTYYVRVKSVAATGAASDWSSPIATASTYSLNAPTSPAATTISASQLRFTWNGAANATSYNLEYSTSSDFSSAVTAISNATSPYDVTSLAAGTTLYFHVKSIATGYSSGWSTPTVNATTVVTPPPAYNMTENSRTWNSLTVTSSAVCASGTVGDYQWYVNGGAWVSGTQYQSVQYNNIQWNQDITLSVNTRCTVNGVNSTYTGANNTISHTTLDSPTAWAANCAERTACWSGGCPAYTTSGSIHWWVNSSSQGQPWVVSDTGLGGTYTWAATGSTWGNGDVRSTTYCNGPWGTATAGGWGPFGSGCVPTISSSWCTV